MNLNESGDTSFEAVCDRLYRAADQKNRQLAKIVGALKKLAFADTLDSPRKVAGAIRILKKSDPAELGLDFNFTELFDTLTVDQARRTEARRLAFGRALAEQAQGAGLTCELLTSDPMELALPPFTVVVDLTENLARLCYARLTVEELGAKPNLITEAHQKNLEKLESGWTSQQFFDALFGAYQIQRIRQKLPRGERVDLSDIVSIVAFDFQNPKFFADPLVNHYRDYARYRFAYDLARLRRAGSLERNGYRLSLGVATGATTRNKGNVLYIEEGKNTGQYYATLWFTAATEDGSP
jgi:hypothetical protein